MEPLDVYRLLAKAEPQPKIIELITKPAEKVSPWWEYRERFLTEQRVAEGAQFMLDHRARLEKARKETGVAPEYVVAIIGVETFYGRITGKYRVLDALATLAFDYPPRAEYFRGELAQFIALSREEAVDPLTALGSYAGAMGAGQFMPSSYRALRGRRQQRQASATCSPTGTTSSPASLTTSRQAAGSPTARCSPRPWCSPTRRSRSKPAI